MNLENYFSILDSNTSEALQLAQPCTTAQLHYNPENGWNILQVLEHIYITDKAVCSMLLRPSEKKVETPEIIGDEKLKNLMVDRRDLKVQAPENIQPKGDVTDVASFEALFLAQRALLKQQLTSGTIALNNGTHKHPFLGEMTTTDWLNFIVHHTQRHLLQIADNMAAFAADGA